MGANISNLGRAIRTILGESMRDIYEFSEELLQSTLRRRLSLRDAERNFTVNAKSHPMQIISCEQGTECKLYISVYDNQNEKFIDITIYQDTATSTESEFEAFWTNPTSGDINAMKFTYPVDARAIKDVFI